MIVNSLKDGWEIIYQRSHANLAAILLAAWKVNNHHPRWTELLIATAQHDDQEMFWHESTHLTDIGAPRHFTEGEMGTTLTQAQWVIDNAYRQGTWIALMISLHNSFLYEPLRGQNSEINAFLDHQKNCQEEWRRLLKYGIKEARQAYSFLQWADSLSLILCCHQIPDFEREIDIAPDLNGKMIRVSQRADKTLLLNPWVFEENEVHVSVEVRKLHLLKFDSETDFQRAMHEAKIEELVWVFRKN